VPSTVQPEVTGQGTAPKRGMLSNSAAAHISAATTTPPVTVGSGPPLFAGQSQGGLLFAGGPQTSNKAITAEYAQSLSDSDLAREIAILEMSVGGVMGFYTITGFTTASALRHNLLILRGE